jgi:UDP-N-acetylmuramoyl-tripeptide--D-alanyl-D-alanine ligase
MMKLWTAADLAAATGAAGTRPFDALSVSIDSRTLSPGALFVALVGENGDGHAHVADALAKGAAGAMVHRRGQMPDSAPLLVVGDTLQGLRDLAAAGRTRFAGRLAAVTGSVGKTTTKEMLRTIFAAQGPTHAAEASHNNHWGVPLTLARLPQDAAWCVAEIGMNHAGEILPLARLARPHAALITNVEAAHIGLLGSIEAIAQEKASILTGVEPGGTAILPADSPLLPLLLHAAAEAKVITFGATAGEARLISAEADADGTDMEAEILGRRVAFRLAAPGRHMAMNAVGALAAAASLGVSPDAGVAALAGFAPITGRGARRSLLGGRALLLDESYNASAVAVRAALAVLRLLPAERRVVVLGDMLELGDQAPSEHKGLTEAVTASADILYACGPNMRHLFEAVPPGLRGAHAADSAALAPIVAAALRPGDAVLVKGSLGSRMKRVVQLLEGAA